jgi:hypothetical protein
MMMMILEVGITEIPTFYNEREKYLFIVLFEKKIEWWCDVVEMKENLL